MVADTPAIRLGSGTCGALPGAGASCFPKTVRIPPGAYVWVKDAPLARPVIEGAMVTTDATVRVTEADDPSYELSPLYCAVMALPPGDNRMTSNARDAVALPPEPDNFAVPRGTPANENATVPVGVPPFVLFTEAVRVALTPKARAIALDERPSVVAPLLTAPLTCQAVARL